MFNLKSNGSPWGCNVDCTFIMKYKFIEEHLNLVDGGLQIFLSNGGCFIRAVLLRLFYSKKRPDKTKARNSCECSPMEEYFQAFSQVIMASKNVWKQFFMGNDWHLNLALRNHRKRAKQKIKNK